MSSIVFLLHPMNVCIAMDSLSVSLETRRPTKFSSKFAVFPHLHGVICATGISDLFIRWISFVNTHIVAHDMDVLDSMTPNCLREISAGMDLPGELSTTIYQFGFIEAKDRFQGFAYRSKADFASEPLIDGFGIKPSEAGVQKSLLSMVEENGIVEGFLAATKQLRDYDNKLPEPERLDIGGEVHYLAMDKSITQLTTIHRFEDYDSHYAEMLRGTRQ